MPSAGTVGEGVRTQDQRGIEATMPLLPPEPCVFPPNLLEGEAAPTTSDSPPESRWWVLHTRPRTEKELARRLLCRKTSYFLPQELRERSSGGRRYSSHLPLFPGYLFLYGAERERIIALETNLIVQCLQVHDQGQLQCDLQRIFQLLDAGVPLTREERLGPGNPVQIVQGPFMGYWGRIIRRDKRLRFVVAVHFLQQGVSVEVERWMIEPVGDCGLADKNPAQSEPTAR